MNMISVARSQKFCALCKYWNGAIGSLTIQIVPGGNMFRLDSNEKHSCFKSGRGMETKAVQNCSCFVKRYED